MRAPRWALALTAIGTIGTSAMVVGLPGSASAVDGDTRYNLEARGDAFYFEVNGEEIPASPKNDAGSLTAFASTTNSGGSRGFAGSPFFGNTAQTLPGTINGVPNQFGAGALQIPFAVIPTFVESSSSSTPEAEMELGFGRVKSSSTETSSTSSASYGAPAAFPAPNQQQQADAKTESTDSGVTASAFGSSSGIVSGPLEIANSTAIASISQKLVKKGGALVASAPKIQSKTFGRFSISGQEFGFDQNGFRYLGQGMSSKDALSQANSALKASNTQIDLAPSTTTKDESGKTVFNIGGLRVTTVQASPSGSGATFQIVYTIGRAQVGAAFAELGASVSGGSTGAAVDTSSTDSSATDSAVDASGTSSIDSFVSPDLAGAAAVVPTTTATLNPDGQVTPVTDGAVTGAPAAELPKTLGFSPVAGQSGDGSEWLYAMLILAGVGVLGGHFLFSRFAVAAKGA